MGLKSGFFQGGGAVYKSSHSQSGCHLGALKKKSCCFHHTWANEIRVSVGRTRHQYFWKFPKWFPCAAKLENVLLLSQRLQRMAWELAFWKPLWWLVAVTVIFTHVEFPYIIMMGRRKRNRLCLNRRDQCYFETRGERSWHCLKFSVRKTNHLG